MTFHIPSNNEGTTLSGAHAANATILTVATGGGALLVGSNPVFPFYRVIRKIDNSALEIVELTGYAGVDQFSVNRGADGTVGLAWVNGDTIEDNMIAAYLNELRLAFGGITLPDLQTQVDALEVQHNNFIKYLQGLGFEIPDHLLT